MSTDYKEKYLKYKAKYMNLQQNGGKAYKNIEQWKKDAETKRKNDKRHAAVVLL